jgi:anaerobic ribonucleoside-triphosphate reductase activating protein
MTTLFLSRLHFPITALGPGRRVGIWLQGCSLHCPGCISADTWRPGRGRTTVASALETMRPWLREADGVTISGGEPFEQPGALLAVLRAIRADFGGDILVYTGFEPGHIEGLLQRADGLIDALMTGPYRNDLPQTLPLRGSDNQALHLLTELGRRRFAGLDAPSSDAAPVLDAMFDDDGTVWLAGIPRQGDFERLSAGLTAAGHRIAVSAERSAMRERERVDDQEVSQVR